MPTKARETGILICVLFAVFGAFMAGLLVGASLGSKRAAPPRAWAARTAAPPVHDDLRMEKTLLATHGVSPAELDSPALERLIRAKIYVPGRYDCARAVRLSLEPAGSSTLIFKGKRVELAFSKTNTFPYFGGGFGCEYRQPAPKPLSLDVTVPGAQPCRTEDATGRLICGKDEYACPEGRFEIQDFGGVFPEERGWWQTPQISRVVRVGWEPARRLFQCVYRDQAEARTMNRAPQFLACNSDGSGFRCQ
jgi:hypothetical protein